MRIKIFGQKGTWKYLFMPSIIGGIKYYKSENEKRVDANPSKVV